MSKDIWRCQRCGWKGSPGEMKEIPSPSTATADSCLNAKCCPVCGCQNMNPAGVQYEKNLRGKL